MGSLGPTGTYLLIVALAAFAVGVHAYSMYGQRIPTEKDGVVRDPISALALPTVAGESAFRRGFAIYLIANEALFGLLISSTIILELSLNAIGKAELVGALTSSDPLNPIVPILASTVVITASQLRPLSQIEHSIRSVAHRIAGIPRNLDSVQEQIRLTSIDEIERAIQAEVHGTRSSENSGNLIKAARKHADEVYESAVSAGLGAFQSDNLRISLTRVFCLYEWTLGYDGEQIWVSDEVKQITGLFNSLKLEFRTFRSNLSRLRTEPALLNNDLSESRVEIWEKIVSDSLMLERRLTVVLSLLLINKPDVELKKYEALAFLRDRTVEEGIGVDGRARNALGLTLLLGSFMAFMSMIAYLSLEKTYRDWGHIQADKLLSLGPYGQATESASIADWLQYFSERMDNAFFETLDFTLIFAVSVWVALILRDALITQKRWPRINPGDVSPVGTYLYMGMLTYLPSFLVFLLLKFVVLMVVLPWRNDAEILDPISLKTFPGFLPEIVMVPLLAFVCVWFVCNYIDQKRYESSNFMFLALQYAALCGGLNFLFTSLRGERMDVDDALARFFVPALVMFALFHVFAKAYRRHWISRNAQHVELEQDTDSMLRRLEIWYRRRRESRVDQNDGIETDQRESERVS
ncbi:MAG: hypothetical protein AB8B63_21275 [Granulosicoccus sp.]